MAERVVAIVGRPNVGKSALFNRLAGRKIAIVHDQPGVTRDRITARCKLAATPFTIVDTGGIGSDVDATFTAQVRAEADIAIDSADVILFVVDGQEGLSPIDQELARLLRRAAKPVLLVINKIDLEQHQPNAAEFSRLGFANQIAVSAEHNRGIAPLVAWIERLLPPPIDPIADSTAPEEISIAIVGRPNVGKSSLANAILRDRRTLVSEIAGTTRDAVDIPYERHGHRYILIDTAGIRPRGKVSSSIEVFSVMRSESSIRRADLSCLVIDATAGITAQDKKIAGMIRDAETACVVAVNKWDLVKERTSDKQQLNAFLAELRSELFFVDYAPLILLSAKTGAEMTRLFKTIERIRAAAQVRIGTGPLNRALSSAMTAHPPPVRNGRRFKVLYATHPENPQTTRLPAPEIVLFCNEAKLLVESYQRFLEGRIREIAPYEGLPLRFRLRGRRAGEGAGAGKKRK